jgi:DNA-binding NtrC family response regulator
MDRPSVLVIEDRPSVLKLMSTILQRSYEVTAEASATAALDLIASRTFDVVLTDVRMPGATGFDVLRAVRDHSPRTRVIMITAYANVADAVSAIRLGAYDYVSKPLDPSEISLVVARSVACLDDESADPASLVAQGAAAGDAADDVMVGFRKAVEEARRRASHVYLVRLMMLHQGNVTQAAKQAGMTRESLHRVLRQYGVRSAQYSGPRLVALGPAPDPARGATGA